MLRRASSSLEPRPAFRPPLRAVLVVVAGAAILLLMVTPLYSLVRGSVVVGAVTLGGEGELGLGNYSSAFGASDIGVVVRNTLLYAAGATALGLLVGGCLAWAVERTDLRGSTHIKSVMFGLMGVPHVLLAFGWLLLLNPNNGLLVSWFGTPVVSVYSLYMMIVISGLGLGPTFFVMLSGVVRNFDTTLVQAAEVSGARRLTAMRRITMPLMRPGTLATCILLFIVMVQVLDTPLVLGLSAGVPVLSTRIYQLVAPGGPQPQPGVAAAFGVILLFVTLVLVIVYFVATRAAERYKVVGGRGYRYTRSSLGRWRHVVMTLIIGYVVVMLSPVAILLWTSLLPFYEPPSLEHLGAFTAANYVGVLQDNEILRAVGNTAVMVFGTATVTMALGSLVAWLRSSGSRLGQALYALGVSSIAVPTVVLGLAFLLLTLHTPLYGTVTLIILTQTATFLAFAVTTMGSVFMQIDPNMERAGIASGARSSTVLRRITVPLVARQFLSGWLWVLANSLRDLTVPLMLFTGSNAVLSTAVWRLWTKPDLGRASALAVIMLILTVLVVIPLQLRMSRRERDFESVIKTH